jgi:hypothetical protein
MYTSNGSSANAACNRRRAQANENAQKPPGIAHSSPAPTYLQHEPTNERGMHQIIIISPITTRGR